MILMRSARLLSAPWAQLLSGSVGPQSRGREQRNGRNARRRWTSHVSAYIRHSQALFAPGGVQGCSGACVESTRMRCNYLFCVLPMTKASAVSPPRGTHNEVRSTLYFC
ncbi:unnamed protein product [Ectocarpus sp. 4 AP-2014]